MNELPKTIKPGETIEVQLAPYGEYPCRDGDPEHEGFIQLVTPAAVERMARAIDGEFSAGLMWTLESLARAALRSLREAGNDR